MARRTKKKAISPKLTQDRTPELLVAAAKKVFALKGYAGTTVREIAKEAGVNLSLVSYHFAGKEGLYRTCIETFGRARLNDAERLLQTPATSDEFALRFQLFVGEIFKSYVEEPELTLMVQREVEAKNPLIEDIFSNTLLKVGLKMKEYFEVGKQKGWVRAEVEPLLTVSMVFGSLIHAMRLQHLMERFFSVSIRQPAFRELYKNQLVSIILNGVNTSTFKEPAILPTESLKPKGRLQS